MKIRLHTVLFAVGAIGALLVPLGLAYGWVLRCGCGQCRCSWGCHCPKYWDWSEASMLATIVAIAAVSIFVAVRRRKRLSASRA